MSHQNQGLLINFMKGFLVDKHVIDFDFHLFDISKPFKNLIPKIVIFKGNQPNQAISDQSI